LVLALQKHMAKSLAICLPMPASITLDNASRIFKENSRKTMHKVSALQMVSGLVRSILKVEAPGGICWSISDNATLAEAGISAATASRYWPKENIPVEPFVQAGALHLPHRLALGKGAAAAVNQSITALYDSDSGVAPTDRAERAAMIYDHLGELAQDTVHLPFEPILLFPHEIEGSFTVLVAIPGYTPRAADCYRNCHIVGDN
jgi:hypothetical protein